MIDIYIKRQKIIIRVLVAYSHSSTKDQIVYAICQEQATGAALMQQIHKKLILGLYSVPSATICYNEYTHPHYISFYVFHWTNNGM